MSHIPTVSESTATPEQQAILTAVRKSLGIVPNLVSTLAQSPAAANAYLAFSGALSKGSLSAKTRELIALAVGEANSCDYCVSAHTYLGNHAGLTEEEVLDARRGTSSEPKRKAALSFIKKLVAERGHVRAEDIESLRQQGFSEGDIVEIVANTALNIFTNYFNHVAATEIDFPVAPKLEAQA
jgi:uncharacterized peroxidase-related enzyme